jgi:hypothetical protein
VASLPLWFKDNWFPLLQSTGIVCGLFFTAISVRRDTKARRTTDLLVLAQQHRDLWGELHRRPELRRIQQKEADLISAPITPAEEEFLNVVFVHFYTGWLLVSEGAIALMPIKALAADIQVFFKLPIPNSVWHQTIKSRDPSFVSFVEKCLAKADS